MTDQMAPRAIPFLRTPAAPAFLATGVAVLGLFLLAEDRREARDLGYPAAVGDGMPTGTATDPAQAFARADAAGLLARTGAPIVAGPPAARPATYAVRPGEDLAAIAAKLYGDPALAPRIAAANDLAPGGPVAGEVLLIPSF